VELTVPGTEKLGEFFGAVCDRIRATLISEDQAQLAHQRAVLLHADQMKAGLRLRNLHPWHRFHALCRQGEPGISRLLKRLGVPGAGGA